jgi:hypothetical protein
MICDISNFLYRLFLFVDLEIFEYGGSMLSQNL